MGMIFDQACTHVACCLFSGFPLLLVGPPQAFGCRMRSLEGMNQKSLGLVSSGILSRFPI